jgi:ketosteroid isomerase-like protein
LCKDGCAGAERRRANLGVMLLNKTTAAVLAGVISVAGLAPVAAMASPADEAQIKALEARFAAAVSASDVDAIMKCYAPDVFVFDVVPPRQYVGAAAYRADWTALFAGFAGPVKFEVTDLVASADGTIGYSRSIQHLSGKNPKGGAIDTTVRVTDVYPKQGDTWLIVQEHVSVPVDLDTGKADLSSKP